MVDFEVPTVDCLEGKQRIPYVDYRLNRTTTMTNKMSCKVTKRSLLTKWRCLAS